MKGISRSILFLGLIVSFNNATADELGMGYNMATGLPEAPASKIMPSTHQVTRTTPPALMTNSVPSALTHRPQAEVGDGFAVGMQVGLASGMAMMDFPSGSGAGQQSRGLGIGFLGGLHLNYGYTFTNQLYLGAQVYGNLENLNYTSRDTSTPSVTWKIGNNAGLLLLPGYHLDSTNLVYAKLGANYGKISFYTNSENSFWKWAPDLGFGFRQGLSKNLSLGLEYDWIKYKDSLSQSNVFNVAGQTTSQFSQRVYLLSIDYQFDDAYPDREETMTKNLQLSGPYLGFNLGLVDQSLEDDYVNVGGTGSDRFQANGYFEQLKLGYGYQLSQWLYLGAEIFGQLAQQVEPEEYSASFNQQKQSFGASFLPGYVVNPNNLLFTRIGYILTQFTGSDQGRGGHGTPYTSNISGMQLGMGYESALASHLSFTIEYDYNYYPKFSEGPSPYGTTQNYSVKDNLMSVGLNYRF